MVKFVDAISSWMGKVFCLWQQGKVCHLVRTNQNERIQSDKKLQIRKRRKLTGRAMTDNWQLVGGKSNKAMDIISSLKCVTSTTTVEDAKKADIEYKKQVETESEAAKALAAELVFSAGTNDSRFCSFTVIQNRTMRGMLNLSTNLAAASFCNN